MLRPPKKPSNKLATLYSAEWMPLMPESMILSDDLESIVPPTTQQQNHHTSKKPTSKKSTSQAPNPPQNLPTSGQGKLEAKGTAKEIKVTKELTELYASIGLIVTRFSMYDGLILIKESENRARELVGMARHHKWLMNALERLTESNDYITFSIGYGMMAYALLAHHGQVPADPVLLASMGYSEEGLLGNFEGPLNADGN